MKQNRQYLLLIIPALIVSLAFFLLPMAKLLWLSLAEQHGISYWYILTKPMYLKSLGSTFLLSAVVTIASLVIATIVGLFLTRHEFRGKSILVAMLSFPLVFPGVVIGFFVIMLSGRQGLFAQLGLMLTGERWMFAYTRAGRFVGWFLLGLHWGARRGRRQNEYRILLCLRRANGLHAQCL